MRSGASLIGIGIFLSRIAGLIRERVLAHYFGNGEILDALRAAIRIPNLLQNLLGEGVLSGSFIPFYSRLIVNKQTEEARELAWALFHCLALLCAAISIMGVYMAPLLVDVIAPGFSGATRDLTVELVQIIFPGTAVLVISAWCLGVLNSHRKFLLPYISPVIWNFAIIGACWFYGNIDDLASTAKVVAWGLVVGSLLQTLVQAPTVFRLVGSLRFTLGRKLSSLHQVIQQFVPIVTARGVVQVSAYLDNVWGSLLATGTIAGLAFAQTLYMLPISLFGMSISASELTEMSRLDPSSRNENGISKRLQLGLQRLRFLVVPSAVAMVTFGDALIAAFFQTGAFGGKDSQAVGLILAAYAVGLLATTESRLLASAFYASEIPRSPLRAALLRVGVGAALGALIVYDYRHERMLGLQTGWALGLVSAIGAWIEFTALKWMSPKAWWNFDNKDRWAAWFCAVPAGVLCWWLNSSLSIENPWLAIAPLLVAFGLVYGALSLLLQPQMLAGLRRRLG
jgi:putative peptidoglycan lipid II flippase